jgi:tripartite-type tricarboxylate transporter receptor subunit TctC
MPTMKCDLARRAFLQLAAGIAALPAASRIARADSYPSRPLTLVVGFPARGGIDMTARLIGQALSDRLGQPLAVENRTGAGTNVATGMVARAQPDGYTLLLSSAANAINASLFASKMDFNFIRDIRQVAGVTRFPVIVLVQPAFRAKDVAALIADMKQNPGKVMIASPFAGTPPFMASALFRVMAGVDAPQRLYQSDEAALDDLVAGTVQVHFCGAGLAVEAVKRGRARALAVTTAARSKALPGLPTVAETIPGYDASAWTGLGVPRDTPEEIVKRLNAAINSALADDKVVARLTELGLEPMPMTPGDFEQFVAAETEKWAKVVQRAGVKAE